MLSGFQMPRHHGKRADAIIEKNERFIVFRSQFIMKKQ